MEKGLSNAIVDFCPAILKGREALRTRGRRPLGILAALMALGAAWASYGCSSRYTVDAPGYGGKVGEVNRHSRVIRAAPEKIYRILTEEASFRRLCPEGTVVTHETPPPYGPGTLIKTRVNHIFKLEWNTRVEEVLPGRLIRLRFLDGFFAGGLEVWDLEGEGPVTRVTQTIVVEPKGLAKRAAWGLKVRRKHDAMVERFLDNLKTLAEEA